MKRAYFVCLFLALTTSVLSQSNPVSRTHQTARVASPTVASAISASQADPKDQAGILDGYGKLPLSFETNQGQTDARVKFLSRTGGYTLFLSGDEAVIAWSGKKTKKTSPQGLKPASLAGPGGAAPRTADPAAGEPAVGKPRFVSGYRFSDTASPAKFDAPLGAGKRPSTLSADPEAVAKPGVLRMKLRNANLAANVTGEDQLPGTSNYFIGNDPAKWRTNVPTYAKVKYQEIYSGIDLVYYGNQRQLEYDFIVAPGADPGRIAFDIRGANRIRRDKRGDLVLKVSEGELRWHKPVVYQEKDGARQLVAARYAITDTNHVGFEVAKYDTSRTLYIDPLIYSTYLGGSQGDSGSGIAIDSAGNAYVTGTTGSTDFPVTPGAFQTTFAGWSAFVTKLNPEGSALIYSTYLGGSSGNWGRGIAVDGAGNAYVTGETLSTDFPVTSGAFQTTCGGSYCDDGFIAKVNPTGSALAYSTYFGGGGLDRPVGIVLDSAGSAYVTGWTESADFPVTSGAFQATFGGYQDCFVTKLNPEGSALVYSTYLGGWASDFALAIAVDSAGNAYVSGTASASGSIPVTPGAFQTTFTGGSDAFVTKFNPAGSALVYSTYLGGSQSQGGLGIAMDSGGDAYVVGVTCSSDFPTMNPLQPVYGGGSCLSPGYDAFVSEFNPSGSALLYSTYLGGSGNDEGSSIALDSAGNAYVTGWTHSTNFPVTPGAFQTRCNHGSHCGIYEDAFVARISPSGSALVYSTYLGGSSFDDGLHVAVDASRHAYVTGETGSWDLPVTSGAFQTTVGGGGEDAFVTKLDVRAVPVITLTSSLNPSTYGQAVTFRAALTSPVGAPPNGETVTFKKGLAVLGTGTLSGGSASFTTSTLPGGANNITAVYGGDSKFAPSASKAFKQVVNKATTTTTLASSLNPSNFGQSVTFTASVKPQYSGTVKGSVTYYDGTTVLKADVGLSGGVAKYTTSTLTVGSHTITATYNGSANFDSSSASLTQTVN